MKLAVCLATLLSVFSLSVSEEVVSPKPGDPLRKKMLDVFRPEVEKELKQRVVFKVSDLRVTDDAAFLVAQPLKSDETPIDYSKTKFQEEIDLGLFDDWLCALAMREGDRWTVVKLIIGATDVPFVGWHDEYGVPRELILGKE